MLATITKKRIFIRLGFGLVFAAGVVALWMISFTPADPIDFGDFRAEPADLGGDHSLPPADLFPPFDANRLVARHRGRSSGVWLARYHWSISSDTRHFSGWTGIVQVTSDVYGMIRVIDGTIILSQHRIIEEFPGMEEHREAVGRYGSRYRKKSDSSFNYHQYRILAPLHLSHDPMTWAAAQEEYSEESWRLQTSLFSLHEVSFPIWVLAALAVVFLATQVAWPIRVAVHRKRHGMCVCCGYSLQDLHSTRCPECGTIWKIAE